MLLGFGFGFEVGTANKRIQGSQDFDMHAQQSGRRGTERGVRNSICMSSSLGGGAQREESGFRDACPAVWLRGTERGVRNSRCMSSSLGCGAQREESGFRDACPAVWAAGHRERSQDFEMHVQQSGRRGTERGVRISICMSSSLGGGARIIGGR